MTFLDTLGYALAIGLALLVHLPIHEQGHVWAMKWAGDRTARFWLFPRQNGKLLAFGIAGGDGQYVYTPQQDRIIDLAGMGLSRVFAALMFGVSFFLRLENSFLLVFWLALYLISHTDFLVYGTRDFLANHVLRRTDIIGDMTCFMRHTAGWRGFDEHSPQARHLYLRVIGLALLDTLTLYWTLPVIVRHLTTAG